MRKTILIFLICLISAMLLAGCKDSESADAALKDKLQNVKADTEKKTPEDTGKDEKKHEKNKKKTEQTQSSAAPEFSIETYSEREERDGKTLIDHSYQQIYVESEDDSFKGLINSLAMLNEDIGMSEDETRQNEIGEIDELTSAELKTKTESGYYPLEEEWNVYVRRADSMVCSVATEYRMAGYEGDYVEMRGYSFLTDSGKELKLSDIVDDEEAFYDLLARELSVDVTNKMMIYTDNYDMDRIDCRPAMDESLKKDEYGWVLDPQGVTFWFDKVNAVLANVTVTVLFTDDTDGTIFNKDFVSNAPDEWIMQIPGHYGETCFDNDEDGITDTISWIVSEIEDNEGNRYPSGIDVCINRRNYLSSEIITSYGGMFYGTIAMLVHKDKQTYFMTYYCEEADPSFVTLSLKDDTVKPADAKYVYIGRSDRGEYVPTNPSAIRVYSDHGGDEITEYPPEIMSIDGDGMLTVREVGSNTSQKSDTAENNEI